VGRRAERKRKREREREIVILAVVLAFLLVGDENSPRNLSHDPGASWDHRVEELRAEMKGKETTKTRGLAFLLARAPDVPLVYYVVVLSDFRERRASCAGFIDVNV